MAISQSSALCMDQWRELFSNAGVDIFEIIRRSIKIAASDRPKEFKNMRGNIAELLFACNYVHNSDDNNLATVEHKATGQRFNINEDVTRGDKESKDSLDGGMDVKGKMVGFDQGIQESCLNEWEGLACPPLDDFMFSYAQASLPQIDLSTFFDGIDDDGEWHVSDHEGISKGYYDMRSNMVGGLVPNMFASSNGPVGLSTSKKAFHPSSQDMLEPLHKVDQSRNRGSERILNSSGHSLSSEMHGRRYSDESLRAFQRSQSSDSQGFGLNPGLPSHQRSPLPDYASNSLNQAHLLTNIRDKGQENLHGGFKNNTSMLQNYQMIIERSQLNLVESTKSFLPQNVWFTKVDLGQMVDESLGKEPVIDASVNPIASQINLRSL
nr:hypothetical protein [Tanacetum cinerariifolium]